MPDTAHTPSLQSPTWTGLICPFCDKAVAIISNRLPGYVVGFCAACGHRWMIAEPEVETRVRYEYQRDDSRKRIHVIAHQPLDSHDLIAIVDRQLRDDAWAYGCVYEMCGHEIIDAADAVEVAEHLETLVEIHGPRGPVAVCAMKMELRMALFAGANTGAPVMVFPDRQQGERWLDSL